MQLEINVAVTFGQAKAAEIAAAQGWTLYSSTNKWGWESIGADTIPGLSDTSDPSYYGRQYSGTPTTVGDYTLLIGSMSEVHGTQGEPHPVTVTVFDPAAPAPEPEPEPTPEPVSATSAKVAAFLGRPGDTKVQTLADVHYPIMAEYVKGYTGGRGFATDGTPNTDVAAVLITATARSVMNPENLSYFTMGDYSERPATTAGWTLHELGVLRRYRKLTNAGPSKALTETSVNTDGSVTVDYVTLAYLDSRVTPLDTRLTDVERRVLVLEDAPEPDPVDLTGYATTTYVDNKVANVPQPDLTPYALKTELHDPVNLAGYATETYVDQAEADAVTTANTYTDTAIGAIPAPDLSGYALKTDLHDPVDLTGYATEDYVTQAVAASAEGGGVPDTGWRDITAQCPWVNPTAGSVGNQMLVRRVGNAVYLDFNNVTPKASGNISTVWNTAYGFRSPIRLDFWVTSSETSARSAYLFANGAVGMWAAANTDAYRQTITWFTANPWPTTLPGVAA